jgi:hypothetical protein
MRLPNWTDKLETDNINKLFKFGQKYKLHFSFQPIYPILL